MKRIFVGGTGRSGTTILSRWLASHAGIARFPIESRFIVDPAGIIDLHAALTIAYSLDQARVAYRSFTHLMKHDLSDRHRSPYQGIDLEAIFGPAYQAHLDELDDKLRIGSFEGWDFHSLRRAPGWSHRGLLQAARLSNRVTGGRSEAVKRLIHPPEKMHAIRHLDVEESFLLLGEFVSGLLDSWACSTGSYGWCEDTPANACHLGFLTRLVPESKHLCAVRNPYGTALSYTQQMWAPSDFSMSVELLASLFKKIIEEIESLSDEQREKVKIIRLEDLAQHETQLSIRRHLGLELDVLDGSVEIRTIRARDEQQKLGAAQCREVERKLGFMMEYFDYTI